MKQRRKDSGFALLLVFLMAACVAIMLYAEMPRVAFEAERQKELLLIDRGNQFKRAIQLFVLDKKGNPTGAYPASIDQLENFNNRRYLRRKYVDPFTGKAEWRLIHYGGAAGVFPDSVAMQKTTQNAKDTGSTGGLFSSTLQSFDAPSTQQQGGVSLAMRRRPSESGNGPGSPDGGMPGAGGSQGSNGDAGGGGNSGSTGSTPSQGTQGGGGQTGGGTGSSGSGGTGGQPCTAYIGNTCVSGPSGTQSGGNVPGQPGAPPTGLPPGMPGAPPTGVPGLPPGGFPGGFPAAPPGGFPGGLPGMNPQQLQQQQQQGMTANPTAQTAAAGMIQGILTSPRPSGAPTTTAGTMVGGGIAGVASKYEAEGIMVINDHTAINEWEYIFDLYKYRMPTNPLAGGPGTPANGSPAGAPGAAGPGGGFGGASTGGGINGGGAGGTVTTGGGRGQ